jgi:hypothetical protein
MHFIPDGRTVEQRDRVVHALEDYIYPDEVVVNEEA